MDSLPFTPSPNESQKAFECFLAYFDLGPNRSLAKAAQAAHVGSHTIKLWADRYQWADRIRDYNTHLLQTRVKVETDVCRDQAKVWAERTEAFKEQEWEATEKLLAAARLHLNALLAKEPGKASLPDVARALEIASRLGRLITGLDAQPVNPGLPPLSDEIKAALDRVYGPREQKTKPATPVINCESTSTALPMLPASSPSLTGDANSAV